MEPAYILMVVVALISFILAFLGASNWITVGMLCLSPVALLFLRMNIGKLSEAGEGLLLLSPFLVAMILFYSVLCFIASTLGRAARRRRRAIK